jgi:CBS domain-containing protein
MAAPQLRMLEYVHAVEVAMNVGQMCSRGVIHVSESATLQDVAVLMRDRHVGAVVVVTSPLDAPVPVGIITDRDIVRAQIEHASDLARLRAADAMTKDLLTLRVDQQLDDAIESMRARGVRRTPVLTAQGALFGFLATDDLVAETVRQLGTLAQLFQRQPVAEPG